MATTFKPFEQVIAEVETAVAIKFGATTPAQELARAQAALAVSQVFQTASTGDLATANQQLVALVGSITDPGLAFVAQQLVSIAGAFLGAEGAALAAVPVLASTVDGILGNIAAGMAGVANAYITAAAKPKA
jgi:hypothetical protein